MKDWIAIAIAIPLMWWLSKSLSTFPLAALAIALVPLGLYALSAVWAPKSGVIEAKELPQDVEVPPNYMKR